MKASILKTAFAGVAVLTAVVGVGSLPARADLGELAALLRSPVGRYLMLETEQGTALAHALEGTAATDAIDLERVIARLGNDEMAPFARELENRLTTARSRFQSLAGMLNGAEATSILQKIASEGLTLRASEDGGMRFVAQNQLGYQMEARAFMNGEHPGKIAGQDFTHHIFEEHIDFAHSDLRFTELSGSEALYGQFSGASMEFADLTGARMKGADFHGADMHGARLSGGGFSKASFRNANLRGADLSHANLIDADFSGADLRGADLSGARVGQMGFQSASPKMQLRGALIDARTRLPESMTLDQARELGATVIGG